MERLQKVMAQAGVSSRRKCEDIITQGRVRVNGQIVTQLGTKVSEDDLITVDGVELVLEPKVYYALNKPRGVISSVSDDKGRKVVTDYFKSVPHRIYPVGRLDYDTSGLILLTNDGEFANMMMHPSYEVHKTYWAKLDGIPNSRELARLEEGIELAGELTAPAQARILEKNKNFNTSLVELIIHEGWNHQVKRMFSAIGYTVRQLERHSLGSLTLDGLDRGQWRPLTSQEIDELKTLAKN